MPVWLIGITNYSSSSSPNGRAPQPLSLFGFFANTGIFITVPFFFVVPEWLANNTTIYLFCKYVPRTRPRRWWRRGLMSGLPIQRVPPLGRVGNSSHQNTTLPNTYTDCQLQQSREWHGCRESDEAPSETHTSQHRTWSRNLGENLCWKVSSNHGWRSITHRISNQVPTLLRALCAIKITIYWHSLYKT